MGKAISLPVRERMVTLKQQGHTLQAISEQLKLSFAAVRNSWNRFRHLGQAGLLTPFEECGPPPPSSTNRVFRAARWLRFRHPQWGSLPDPCPACTTLWAGCSRHSYPQPMVQTGWLDPTPFPTQSSRHWPGYGGAQYLASRCQRTTQTSRWSASLLSDND
jgi:hypothetical protein